MERAMTAGIFVTSVNMSERTGTVKRAVPEVTMDARGIVGDAHAGDWHRQVSLLGQDDIDGFKHRLSRPLEPGEFAENIALRGVDLGTVSILDRFRIGEVELEVTQIGKECHGSACAIFREVGECIMPRRGLFARVLSGGVVRSGDPVVYTPHPFRVAVLTLSDRASRGEYEDRSGPRVRGHLESFFGQTPWHLEVENHLLPDDPVRLRGELTRLRDEGVDIVITTGGTGVGPRDVTPDVVEELADRLIPGIMDVIRVKFGLEKPNAVLSRSVVALLGGTVVYALPGSVKAVDDYMGEILKTMEHVVLMLHGLGH